MKTPLWYTFPPWREAPLPSGRIPARGGSLGTSAGGA